MTNETELLLAKLKRENPGISSSEMSRRSGVPRSSVDRWIHRVKGLALKGLAPDFDMTHPVPDGYVVKGVSTNYNAEGEISQQWVKTSIDREKTLEALQVAVESIIEVILCCSAKS